MMTTAAKPTTVQDHPDSRRDYETLARTGREINASEARVAALRAGETVRDDGAVTEALLRGEDVAFDRVDDETQLERELRRLEALRRAQKLAQQRYTATCESVAAGIMREYRGRIDAARERAVAACRELGAVRRAQLEIVEELREAGISNPDVGLVPAAATNVLEAWLVAGRPGR